MAKRTQAVTSRVSYLKRSKFGLKKKELHADPRVVLEGNFSFRKYPAPLNISMRQVNDSPMRRAIKRSMTMLKFARAKQAGNQRVVRTLLKACTPIKLPPENL